VGELALIDALDAVFARTDGRVVRSIGDDAAVIRAGAYAVVSVDTMVDGIHFRRGELSSGEVGARALAAALSDVAAMAADPGEAFLALGVPSGLPDDEVLELARGARRVADEHDVAIAGGDVTAAPALTVSFTVIGWVGRPEAVVARDGARIGDRVCVTGRLGGAGAGLAIVERRAGGALAPAVREALRTRYARPHPRFAAARELARHGARAMIDLSDGLATDASHMATASGVRLELRLGAIPLEEGVSEVASELGLDPRAFAATAGEDFELCVCLPPQAVERLSGGAGGVQLAVVGEVVPGPAGVNFLDYEGELVGYEHRF
jgi:thiamine-monophosphate kinase